MKTFTPSVDFDQIKKTTDIVRVVESYGVVLRKTSSEHFKGLCPFHKEKTPSFSVTPSNGLFHCFGCHAGGDVIRFVALKEGIGDNEAKLKLLTQIPGVMRASDAEPTTTGETKEPIRDPVLFAAIIEHYHETLFGTDRRGLDYFKSRGLADLEMLKHFKVGFVNGTLKEKLSLAQVETAKAIGLLNEKGNDKFYLRVVVPIFNEHEQPVGLCGRDITNTFEAKYLYLEGGHRAVWNAEAAKVYPDELIVTEAIFDGLALWKAGKKNVIASYGAGGWTPHHTALIQKHSVRKVVMAYDNDPAGDTGVAKHSEVISALGVEVYRLKFPDDIKDANEFFLKGGTLEAFSSLLAAAVCVAKPAAKKARLTLVEKTDEFALFKTVLLKPGEGGNGSVDYRVRGLTNNGSMRLVLTAKQGEAVHTDHFDLYASKSRSAFSSRCAERFGVEAAKIEEDLTALLEMLEKMKEEEASPVVVAKPAMSESEKAEALSFLRSANLLEETAAHLEVVGYVGDQRVKQLAYLIATSRKLPTPLSGIFRSQSGAGKSFLMECVADLMPPEDVHYFSRLTPQALYYMEPDALKHKLLIVDERNGSEEAEYPIRTLQTRKILKLAAPIKDPSTGKIRTVILVIYGPMSYMESTTEHRINPENANRSFELYLDESQEQTRAIFAAQRRARSLEGWRAERRRLKILPLHHHAQRLLRSLKVIVPYVELIEFPASWLRGRRDNDRLLSLIEGVAFLHQYQRPIGRDGEGEYIEASVEDYRLAYDLAHQIFAQAASDLPKPVAEFQETMERAMRAEAAQQKVPVENFWFMRRMVREATGLPDHLVKTYMRQLEDLEHIEVQRSARGGCFRYRLLTRKTVRAVLQGLTTPEELARKWKSGRKVEQG